MLEVHRNAGIPFGAGDLADVVPHIIRRVIHQDISRSYVFVDRIKHARHAVQIGQIAVKKLRGMFRIF